MAYLKITNDGQSITSTDYWATPAARRGFAFLSLNAGAMRLLVPQPMQHMLPEMLTETVVITRGQIVLEARQREAVEVMFEDQSDNPFALHIVAEQVNPLPDHSWMRRPLPFHLYTGPETTLRHQATAWYRTAKRLPYLKPYDTETI